MNEPRKSRDTIENVMYNLALINEISYYVLRGTFEKDEELLETARELLRDHGYLSRD